MNQNSKPTKRPSVLSREDHFLSQLFGAGQGLKIELIPHTFTCLDPVTGKPVTYNVIFAFAYCLWSKLIAGFCLELEGNMKRAIVGAICAAVKDKARLCRELNLQYQPDSWPNMPLPEFILCNFGEAPAPKFCAAISESLDVRFVVERSPAEPALKDAFESLAAKVFFELEMLGSPVLEDTVLALEDCRRLMAAAVIHQNEAVLSVGMIPADFPSDLMPTPANIYRWGMANRTGNRH